MSIFQIYSRLMPGTKFFDSASIAAIRRLFGENFSQYWRRYAVAVFFMVVVSSMTALSAWIISDVVNGMLVDHRMSLLAPLFAIIVAIYLTKGFATYAQDVTLGRVGNRIIADVQRRVYAHVLKFGLDYFTNQSSSDMIMRVSGGSNATRDVMNTVVVSLGRDLLTLIGLVIVMFFKAPLLSIIALIIAPIAIFGVSNLIKRVRNVMTQEFALATRSLQLLQETVHGARIIKAFNLGEYMKGQMDNAVTSLEQRANRINSLQARSSPLMESLGGISIGLIMLYSGWASATGRQTPGDLISFLFAFQFAYEPAKRLARIQLTLEPSIFGVRMMFEVLDTPPAQTETEGDRILDGTTGTVAFQDVSFSYRAQIPVLQDVSFEVTRNSKTALVGPSGGGKSTIFSLLQRFYDVTGGTILLDGIDIRTLSVKSLRSHIAFVSQDTYLFGGTVRDNIRIGRLGATNEEVEAAARDAFAHDFICGLRNGYDTDVGENGVQLSGGQRQRIAIARAMLKGAPILLLDEATSALDSESEHMVQMAFDRLMHGRTTIVIAHRLSTILNADRIFVLDQGRIVESGTHANLVDAGGLYSRLYLHQFDDKPVAELQQAG